jgi:ABC-type multidrug transport system ATPase subunit
MEGEQGEIRLQKYLAQRGVASRRKCEELIAEGRVSLNGAIVQEMGVKVLPSDRVEVDGAELASEEQKTYIAFYKPTLVVTTAGDPEGRQTVMDFFRDLPSQLNEKDLSIAKQVLKEINERLGFLKNVGLGYLSLSRAAKTLSGGWQRRLSIAMALISEPQILFLDEPTLGLDVIARRELWKSVEKLKGSITIILTTHYLEEAEALSDRIGVMARGRLKAVGTAAELKRRAGTDNFEDAFIALAEEGA